MGARNSTLLLSQTHQLEKFQTDRTKESAPFEVVGPDFLGPKGYKIKTKKEGKAYILLFAFTLTRAVHPE